MAQIDVEPRMVTGKDSEGRELEVDAALLLATDASLHETFARALQELLDKGFSVDQCISVGFIIGEVFQDEETVIAFPKERMETYLPEYVKGDYTPPGARTPA